MKYWHSEDQIWPQSGAVRASCQTMLSTTAIQRESKEWIRLTCAHPSSHQSAEGALSHASWRCRNSDSDKLNNSPRSDSQKWKEQKQYWGSPNSLPCVLSTRQTYWLDLEREPLTELLRFVLSRKPRFLNICSYGSLNIPLLSFFYSNTQPVNLFK